MQLDAAQIALIWWNAFLCFCSWSCSAAKCLQHGWISAQCIVAANHNPWLYCSLQDMAMLWIAINVLGSAAVLLQCISGCGGEIWQPLTVWPSPARSGGNGWRGIMRRRKREKRKMRKNSFFSPRVLWLVLLQRIQGLPLVFVLFLVILNNFAISVRSETCQENVLLF